MGSAPVSQSLMQALHRALPKAAITNAYGTTEAGPVVFGPHPKGLPQPEMSVGYPHPQVQLRLVDGGNRDAGEGVLEMKCPAVMNGYHNRPDVPPPITSDGYYITGDVFRRDDERLPLFRRPHRRHVRLRRREHLSRRRRAHAGAASRRSRRRRWCRSTTTSRGTKPVAFVIPKPGQAPSEDEVKQFALANAPAYQHPRFVWFVDELPLASTNKVDRNQLMRMADGAGEGQRNKRRRHPEMAGAVALEIAADIGAVAILRGSPPARLAPQDDGGCVPAAASTSSASTPAS